MNTKLYNTLVKQFEDSVTVSDYKKHSKNVLRMIKRLTTSYPFLDVGAKVEFKDEFGTKTVTIKEFYLVYGKFTEGDSITVITDYDNFYYHETKRVGNKILYQQDESLIWD